MPEMTTKSIDKDELAKAIFASMYPDRQWADMIDVVQERYRKAAKMVKVRFDSILFQLMVTTDRVHRLDKAHASQGDWVTCEADPCLKNKQVMGMK